MNHWLFIFAVLILTTLSSCKKTESIERVGIAGKWQLKEVFDGYANGGNFQWNNVSENHSHSLDSEKMDNISEKKIKMEIFKNAQEPINFKQITILK